MFKKVFLFGFFSIASLIYSGNFNTQTSENPKEIIWNQAHEINKIVKNAQQNLERFDKMTTPIASEDLDHIEKLLNNAEEKLKELGIQFHRFSTAVLFSSIGGEISPHTNFIGQYTDYLREIEQNIRKSRALLDVIRRRQSEGHQATQSELIAQERAEEAGAAATHEREETSEAAADEEQIRMGLLTDLDQLARLVHQNRNDIYASTTPSDMEKIIEDLVRLKTILHILSNEEHLHQLNGEFQRSFNNDIGQLNDLIDSSLLHARMRQEQLIAQERAEEGGAEVETSESTGPDEEQIAYESHLARLEEELRDVKDEIKGQGKAIERHKENLTTIRDSLLEKEHQIKKEIAAIKSEEERMASEAAAAEDIEQAHAREAHLAILEKKLQEERNEIAALAREVENDYEMRMRALSAIRDEADQIELERRFAAIQERMDREEAQKAERRRRTERLEQEVAAVLPPRKEVEEEETFYEPEGPAAAAAGAEEQEQFYEPEGSIESTTSTEEFYEPGADDETSSLTTSASSEEDKFYDVETPEERKRHNEPILAGTTLSQRFEDESPEQREVRLAHEESLIPVTLFPDETREQRLRLMRRQAEEEEARRQLFSRPLQQRVGGRVHVTRPPQAAAGAEEHEQFYEAESPEERQARIAREESSIPLTLFPDETREQRLRLMRRQAEEEEARRQLFSRPLQQRVGGQLQRRPQQQDISPVQPRIDWTSLGSDF